ncbi:MAG: permease-like cell division protein FtsX [Myxococcaceae bacterium]
MSLPAKASYFGRAALGGMWRSPFVHVVAIASLAITLVGFALARLASGEVDALVDTMSGEVELTVYLKEGSTQEQAEQLRIALANHTAGVAKTVSPQEALERLEAQLGDQGKGLSSLPRNPLPWSVEVALPPGGRDLATLRSLADRAQKLDFVEQVDFGEQALERLTAIARGLKLATLVAFAIVFLTTVVVVSATLQLAIYARREEIEIQKLVGGTDRFVRAPFLIEGLLQGSTGAAVASLAVWLFVRFGVPKIAVALGFADTVSFTGLLHPRLFGELFALGGGLGLAGSVVAVRRFLRV